MAVPDHLQQRLLSIPNLHVRPTWRSHLNQPVGWKHVAAVAVIAVAAVASYLLWPNSVRPLKLLNPAVAGRIASLAVANHKSPTLLITSGDRQTVAHTLQSSRLPFTVTIPNPNGNATLLGGGLTNFDSAPAVFTRWQASGLTYTLYQFDGSPLQMPTSFLPTNTAPAPPSGTSPHYHALIWPGAEGQGDWALVLETDSAPNIFQGCN